MEFALIMIGTVVACALLRNPIHKAPMVFYALAVGIDVLFVACSYFEVPRWLWLAMFELIQTCMLPLAMFVLVMYIGCFKKGSKPYTWFKPIRAELSIIAWILSLGHCVVYLMSYMPRVTSGAAVTSNVMAAFVLAIVILILLIVLGVTSFGFVKKAMKTETWKKVQKLAYPFFGLVYVHLLLMLGPSAMRGGQAAIVSVAVYSVVFGVYLVWRVARALSDKRAGGPAGASVASASFDEPLEA
ncbi:ferric reductase-like transmembrane domain-containing protein [Xiamenia xianingshaonis]|uniref:Ferric reductase-like transmembrane domain-containing protein n=1 Tax=Xiamenia xianingshaonis TaxID=2682776 RepID=A0A9E6SVF3_9ACTN|nr:ferric reductase-like transmembrane domain-containing protein [Xiamenia xianingshaonis]NHM13766.1 hypothetical protein [Xiamenia xianingshaonis]QTU85132.1 ferric reductase-like transmembrane domain-containing protein [Xiamenia xianingshaonis]